MRPTLSLTLFLPALSLAAGAAALHGSHEDETDPTGTYDPMAVARDSAARTVNWEATVVAACYTKTDGASNPCWVCHTIGVQPNDLVDFRLQEEYAFSDVAMSNHWANLFEDRSAEAAKISDEEIRAWIAEDNYGPLRTALEALDLEAYPGFRPDLDFDQGFDAEGFANDGSGWRALRYKPFPGTFWPTNGATDDVFVRLPRAFRTRDGEPNREVEKANLTILEAAIAADPRVKKDDALRREIEPLDERAISLDLDRDGRLGGVVTEMRGLPETFVGDARDVAVERYIHPEGVEYLHTVRYVDPSSPTGHSRRMKEVRWSRKDRRLDTWGILDAYYHEDDAKNEGLVPVFSGAPDIGLTNDFGWRLQGFIEDGEGRLRVQTDEEARFCMGCHSAIGVTVDQTFTLARKVPGLDGWRYQDLAGIQDVPQVGHGKGEILTYFERVKGGDEFRANTEMLERFFEADGSVKEKEALRAAVGGPEDIRALVMPSERRALDLNKAYRVLVSKQRWDLGRDVVIGGPLPVHESIENGDTELNQSGLVFRDGRVWLDWDAR